MIPDRLAEKCNYKMADDLFAALGAGDVRLAQAVNAAQQLVEPPTIAADDE